MRNIFFIFILFPFFYLSQKERKDSKHKHVYDLPFEAGKTVLIMQGYNGKFSHVDKYALDFRLRKGKLVCAARGGIVLKVVEHNNIGGANIKYINKGNYVVIDHGDGTYGGYWHLQENGALVDIGDTIKKGNPIGKSGSTGFSSMPHLHFMVYSYDQKGRQYTLPTLFKTKKKGNRYLKSYSWVKHH
tara:strand:+ start:389 stop:949 length:561 start_codon:yes stop_codon:yes gene_type:complete